MICSANAGSDSLAKAISAPQASSTMQTAQVSSDKINVNTASVSELATLKGVGSVKAQAIKQYQRSNGDFSSLADLEEVSGIGSSVIEENKNRIAFN
ncbi:ComEA family DNA-binding protein [Shewanella surugensis]|uniref:ComEA family DNA-binding protein n=1 Tax=Shewanella surugensis TaxID=212020 RepID=A0ABT0L8A1_9GAMM|nr:ComEA family DNA-binding protein [Shewanella surugensis]MCL1123923.1 ComEA family DNA-binding protein [Shewanella surugensis]